MKKYLVNIDGEMCADHTRSYSHELRQCKTCRNNLSVYFVWIKQNLTSSFLPVPVLFRGVSCDLCLIDILSKG